VTEVVRPTRQRRGRDGRRPCEEPGLLPHSVVRRGRNNRSLLAEEEPAVVRRTEGVRGARPRGEAGSAPASRPRSADSSARGRPLTDESPTVHEVDIDEALTSTRWLARSWRLPLWSRWRN
jgi:hypothetical protein